MQIEDPTRSYNVKTLTLILPSKKNTIAHSLFIAKCSALMGKHNKRLPSDSKFSYALRAICFWSLLEQSNPNWTGNKRHRKRMDELIEDSVRILIQQEHPKPEIPISNQVYKHMSQFWLWIENPHLLLNGRRYKGIFFWGNGTGNLFK
jgi:hypothetical protein